MAQKLVNLDQIESGELTYDDLQARMDNLDEDLQDSLGGILTDSNSVDFTYTSNYPSSTIVADLRLDGNSLSIGTGGVKVANIDADVVNVTNLETDNFKAGVIVTTISNSSDTTIPTEQAVKSYVDSLTQGIKWKEPVRVTSTIELSATYSGGVLTADANGSINTSGIDGITDLVIGDRILVQGQTTNPEDNGIYEVTTLGDGSNPYTLTRTTDADVGTEFPQMAVFVKEGTNNADQAFVLTTDGDITVGTTELTYVQFTGLGQITAGAGLSKSGNTLDVNVDDSTIEINTDSLRVKDDGITAAKLNADTAGDGLVQNGTTGALDVNPGDGIEISTDTVTTKLDGNSISKSTSGIKVANIDADVVNVTNLETDNLKSGVLDTDLSNGTSANHDTLVSAKAVYDYITDENNELYEQAATAGLEPVTFPISLEIQNYTVVSAGETAITIPNSKNYEVGKNTLTVYRNGIYQILGEDYTETTATSITYIASKLKAGDVLTFVIMDSSKLAYTSTYTYTGDQITGISFSGDIDRTVTLTYVSSGAATGKISTVATVEDGVTVTKTYSYNATSGKLESIASVIS